MMKTKSLPEYLEIQKDHRTYPDYSATMGSHLQSLVLRQGSRALVVWNHFLDKAPKPTAKKAKAKAKPPADDDDSDDDEPVSSSNLHLKR